MLLLVRPKITLHTFFRGARHQNQIFHKNYPFNDYSFRLFSQVLSPLKTAAQINTVYQIPTLTDILYNEKSPSGQLTEQTFYFSFCFSFLRLRAFCGA